MEQLTKWEKDELKYYLLQYDQKRRKAASLYIRPGCGLSDAAPGSGSDSVKNAALRKRLLKDVEMITQAACQASGGGWEKSLIENCCRGKPYRCLERLDMPSSKQEAYFNAKRDFYQILHTLRELSQ